MGGRAQIWCTERLDSLVETTCPQKNTTAFSVHSAEIQPGADDKICHSV